MPITIAGFVVHPVTDDDDPMRASGGVDDAMATAERLSFHHPVQNGGDLLAVFGMFVAEQQFGGGRDGAWLVAMQSFDVFRPFPPMPVDVETETAYPLRLSGAHRKFDCFAIPVDVARATFPSPWVPGVSASRPRALTHRDRGRRREDVAA